MPVDANRYTYPCIYALQQLHLQRLLSSTHWGEGTSEFLNRIELNRIDSFMALNRIESNHFLFSRIAHH